MRCEEVYVQGVVDEYIDKYSRLADLAFERGWFHEQEQYLMVVEVLKDLKRDLV